MIKPCSKCGSKRIVLISAKCSDRFSMRWWDGKDQHGYVPPNLGIGGDDYVEFAYCVNCGQIQDFHAEVNDKYREKDESCTSLRRW